MVYWFAFHYTFHSMNRQYHSITPVGRNGLIMRLIPFALALTTPEVLSSIQLWSDEHETAPQSFGFISSHRIRKQTGLLA